MAKIKNTRTPFGIDFGVGDVIIPRQEKMTLPVQLEGFELPVVNTYSLESTISEKLDAMLSFMEFSSRMKDYYDICYLADNFEFDGQKLYEAVKNTFINRGRVYDITAFAEIVSFTGNESMNTKWRGFIKKSKLPPILFNDVIETINIFLKDIYRFVIEDKKFLGFWNPLEKCWINAE